jgi:hypothetical protein
LKAVGRVSFTWEAFPRAASFRLEIISPTGKKVVFTTSKPSHDRYVESLPWGGVFTLQVVALDVQGKPIGFAGPFTFEKPMPPPKTGSNGKSRGREGREAWEVEGTGGGAGGEDGRGGSQ